MGYIYKLYFLNTPDKIYIGQSRNNNREKEHKKKLRKGTHFNQPLQNAYNKYGENNLLFEILEIVDEKDLDEKEISYIKKFNATETGYNLKLGGHRAELSEKSKQKLIQTRISRGSIKPVYCYKINGFLFGIYYGYAEASKMTGVGESNIRQIIYGRMKKAKGFHFSLTPKSNEQVSVAIINNCSKSEFKENHCKLFSGSKNPMFGKKRPDISGDNNPYKKMILLGYKPQRKILLTEDEIISLYKNGSTQVQIAKKAECTQVNISQILRDNNIQKFSRRKSEADLYFSK